MNKWGLPVGRGGIGEGEVLNEVGEDATVDEVDGLNGVDGVEAVDRDVVDRVRVRARAYEERLLIVLLGLLRGPARLVDIELRSSPQYDCTR